MEDVAQPVDSDVNRDDHLKHAKMANSMGLIAVMLCLVSPCSSYMSTFLALPVAMMGLHYARRVLAEQPDDVSEAYARTGMTLSVVSLAYAALVLMFLVVFISVYVAFIAAAIMGNL